jgi:hypothetical protein
MEPSGNGFSACPYIVSSGRKRSRGNHQIVHLARATMQAEVTHARAPERIVGREEEVRTLSTGQVIFAAVCATAELLFPDYYYISERESRSAALCLCASRWWMNVQ